MESFPNISPHGIDSKYWGPPNYWNQLEEKHVSRTHSNQKTSQKNEGNLYLPAFSHRHNNCGNWGTGVSTLPSLPPYPRLSSILDTQWLWKRKPISSMSTGLTDNASLFWILWLIFTLREYSSIFRNYRNILKLKFPLQNKVMNC